MAACGSLQHIFEKPLPENPTLIESLSSWKQSKSLKPIDDSSFTEIFGELHFKENHPISSSSSSSVSASSSSLSSFSSCLPPSSASSSLSSSSSSSFFLDAIRQSEIDALDNKDKNDRNKSPISSYYPVPSNKKQDRHSDSFSSRTSDSLSMCTEGLGFESSDDIDDLMNALSIENQQQQQRQRQEQRRRLPRLENQVINHDYSKRSRTNKGSFPPPISCIGRSGKPWVCFKSFREDGRFILKEIRIPTQEFLHACREDGRLMMHVIHSDDEILDDDDDDEEEEIDDDDDDSQNVEDDEGHDNHNDANM